MRVGDVIAEIMKRERVKVLFVYPLTPLTEYAAAQLCYDMLAYKLLQRDGELVFA